uniref:GCR085 n=1 Tax=Schmidtea mediterranea TaxID=79327 RepID=A0A193KUB4_SCHMD|nr:GCR085 [Schmidtea mediterranea]
MIESKQIQEHLPDPNSWLDLVYMILFLIILGVTWLLNLFLLLAIYRNRKGKGPLHNIDTMRVECKCLPNYYFIVSISVANILAVSFNPPIIIVFRWLNFNNNPLWKVYCLIEISINTIFCNLAFLHILFSSLDTFLRLYSPKMYIYSQRPSTNVLKISAPWVVTCIQAGCQLSISSKDSLRSRLLHCLIDDVNFLILRSVISFAVPLLACVILTILQLYFLRKLSHITDETMRHLFSTYLYNLELPENFVLIHRSVQNNNNINNVNNNDTEMKINFPSNIPRDITGETLASIQSTTLDAPIIHFHPQVGMSHVALDFTANHQQAKLIKSVSLESARETSPNNISENKVQKRVLWNFMYQREQMSIALNMASCIVAIGIWSPLILSTLTFRLCEQSSCFFQIPVERISNFHWWSFAGGAIYPIVYMCLDKNLRRIGAPLCNR